MVMTKGGAMGFWKSAFTFISDFLPSSVKRGEEVNTYTAGLFGLTIIRLLAGLAIVLVTPLTRLSVATGVSTGVVALLSALMCFAAGPASHRACRDPNARGHVTRRAICVY